MLIQEMFFLYLRTPPTIWKIADFWFFSIFRKFRGYQEFFIENIFWKILKIFEKNPSEKSWGVLKFVTAFKIRNRGIRELKLWWANLREL